MKYWGYRINNAYSEYFKTELNNGRLRQGWGWDPGQDLRHLTFDGGAKKNMRMLKEVKKGDVLLIPHLPKWNQVTIAVATEDWDTGYNYNIDPNKGDFGHIFPAMPEKIFDRHSSVVKSGIRSTLHNVGRFWNIDKYSCEIEDIRKADSNECEKAQLLNDRYECSIEDIFYSSFNQDGFKNALYDRMIKEFNASEWEWALVEGLRSLYPTPYFEVEKVGGTSEVHHGCDIFVKTTGLGGIQYVTAIQVKDYESIVSGKVTSQVNKVENYFKDNDNVKIIDKIVIVTRAQREDNLHLINNCENVRYIFADELKELINSFGLSYMSKNLVDFNSR